MPRDYEIKYAFISAITREPSERYVVTTQDFVHQLEQVNWHFSLREANQWIRIQTTIFKDISTQEEEAKTYMHFNLKGGI